MKKWKIGIKNENYKQETKKKKRNKYVKDEEKKMVKIRVEIRR